MCTLNFTPDIICITETRLKDQPLINIDLPNYTFLHENSVSAVGGVAVYVSTRLSCNLCPVQHQLTTSEFLWLNVSEKNSNFKFIIGVVYRHPVQTSVKDFLESFNNCLAKLSQTKLQYYIPGDFNINIHPKNRSNPACEYINTIVSHGAVPLIIKPTRVTETFSTLIDHIITNDMEHSLIPEVIQTDITDHYPILCAVTKPRYKPNNKAPLIFYREKSPFRAEAFCEDLHSNLINSFSTQPVLNTNNYNQSFNLFSQTIMNTIDKHAPLKRLSRKQKRLSSKPWITKSILVSIRKNRSMFKSHFLEGDAVKKSFFKKYTNKLTKLKALSKKLYYSKELKNNQNNPRKTWDVIRSAFPASYKRSTDTPQSLKINECRTNDPQKIADHFN